MRLAHYIFSKDLTGNLVLIKTGHGVGAGIVLGGQLFQGDGFGAGEIGHIVVKDDGEQCRCGNVGCLETIVSDHGILRLAHSLAFADPYSALNSPNRKITLESIGTAAQAGDDAAFSLINSIAHYLGIACANLIGTLNARRVVLAGSIIALGAPLLDAVRSEVIKRSLPTLAQNTTIEMDQPNPNSVIHGASILVLNHELGFSRTR